MNNCYNCKNYIQDDVTDFDCQCIDEMTEDEKEKYITDGDDGCPYWKTDITNWDDYEVIKPN